MLLYSRREGKRSLWVDTGENGGRQICGRSEDGARARISIKEGGRRYVRTSTGIFIYSSLFLSCYGGGTWSAWLNTPGYTDARVMIEARQTLRGSLSAHFHSTPLAQRKHPPEPGDDIVGHHHPIQSISMTSRESSLLGKQVSTPAVMPAAPRRCPCFIQQSYAGKSISPRPGPGLAGVKALTKKTDIHILDERNEPRKGQTGQYIPYPRKHIYYIPYTQTPKHAGESCSFQPPLSYRLIQRGHPPPTFFLNKLARITFIPTRYRPP